MPISRKDDTNATLSFHVKVADDEQEHITQVLFSQYFNYSLLRSTLIRHTRATNP